MFHWDGKYFVTLIQGRRVWRQDAWKPLPNGPCTIAATDNGMQGREYYRAMLAKIRAELKSGGTP